MYRETLSFCETCNCGTSTDVVDCNFGFYQIRLEKTGFESWTKEIFINPGDHIEENPVLSKSESGGEEDSSSDEKDGTPTSSVRTRTPVATATSASV